MTEVEIAKLKTEIKEVILKSLNITDIKPGDIENSAPLFAKDNILGLDSIDAIELIMTIQKHFNVRIADQNLARHVLESIDTIAEFLIKERENK
jgi:acyl carrier protein